MPADPRDPAAPPPAATTGKRDGSLAGRLTLLGAGVAGAGIGYGVATGATSPIGIGGQSPEAVVLATVAGFAGGYLLGLYLMLGHVMQQRLSAATDRGGRRALLWLGAGIYAVSLVPLALALCYVIYLCI